MLKRFYGYVSDLQKTKVTGLWNRSQSPLLYLNLMETVTSRGDDRYGILAGGHACDRGDDHDGGPPGDHGACTRAAPRGDALAANDLGHNWRKRACRCWN